MPYTFGVAGGSCVTDSAGKVLLCDVGCGRQAVNQHTGLNLCQLCTNNMHILNLNSTAMPTNALKSVLVTNKNVNLRGN